MTIGVVPCIAWRALIAGADVAAARAHSGHCHPTDAVLMQVGQIGASNVGRSPPPIARDGGSSEGGAARSTTRRQDTGARADRERAKKVTLSGERRQQRSGLALPRCRRVDDESVVERSATTEGQVVVVSASTQSPPAGTPSRYPGRGTGVRLAATMTIEPGSPRRTSDTTELSSHRRRRATRPTHRSSSADHSAGCPAANRLSSATARVTPSCSARPHNDQSSSRSCGPLAGLRELGTHEEQRVARHRPLPGAAAPAGWRTAATGPPAASRSASPCRARPRRGSAAAPSARRRRSASGRRGRGGGSDGAPARGGSSSSVSCIQPRFHFRPNPRPPWSTAAVTPGQAVDSSAITSAPGCSSATATFSSRTNVDRLEVLSPTVHVGRPLPRARGCSRGTASRRRHRPGARRRWNSSSQYRALATRKLRTCGRPKSNSSVPQSGCSARAWIGVLVERLDRRSGPARHRRAGSAPGTQSTITPRPASWSVSIEEPQVVGVAAAGVGGVVAGDLVAPRPAERMAGHRHQLDVGEPEARHMLGEGPASSRYECCRPSG